MQSDEALERPFIDLLTSEKYEEACRIYREDPKKRAILGPIWQELYQDKIKEKKFSKALMLGVLFGRNHRWITHPATMLAYLSIKHGKYKKAMHLLKRYPVDYFTIVGAIENILPGTNNDLRRLLESLKPSVHLEPSEILNLLNASTRILQRSPFREGWLAHLPENQEIVVTGDLHGNRRNLDIFLKIADLENHPGRHIVFQEIVHDRSLLIDFRDLSFLEIVDVLKYLVRFPNRVHLLLGNHDLNIFLGKETTRSKKKLNYFFERGMNLIFKQEVPEILEAYRRLIFEMSAAIKMGSILLTHSNPDIHRPFEMSSLQKKVPLESNPSIQSLVIGRNHSQETVEPLLKKAGSRFSIIGHEICLLGYELPNDMQIVLDSCHPKGYYLICVPSAIESIQDLKKGLRPIRNEEE